MPFFRAKQYIAKIEEKEKKGESVNVEDVLLLMSGLCEDFTLPEQPVENYAELSKHLRKQALVLEVLTKKHRNKITPEKRLSGLEKSCKYLHDWEKEVCLMDHDDKTELFDISKYLSEKNNNEEKFSACMKLQTVFDEHGEFLQNINNELKHEEKKLVIDMLQME